VIFCKKKQQDATKLMTHAIFVSLFPNTHSNVCHFIPEETLRLCTAYGSKGKANRKHPRNRKKKGKASKDQAKQKTVHLAEPRSAAGCLGASVQRSALRFFAPANISLYAL
jgi:hypothetical protein